MISRLLSAALVIVAMVLVLRQCRKPWGWLGRFYIWLMNFRHAGVTSWGLGHVRIGKLAIIAETFRGQTAGWLLAAPMALLQARYLTVEEHRALFAGAGFVDVVVNTDARKGWICAVGRKP